MSHSRPSPFYLLAIALLAGLLLIGCAPSGPPGDNIAKQKAEAIFTAIEQQDFDRAVSLYPEPFFNVTSRRAWKQRLEGINRQLGALQGYELNDLIVNTVFSGTRYTLEYKTRYTNGEADETLIFFHELNQDQVNLVSHKFESDQLTRE